MWLCSARKIQNQLTEWSFVKIITVDKFFFFWLRPWSGSLFMLKSAFLNYHKFHLISELYHCNQKICPSYFHALGDVFLSCRQFYYFRILILTASTFFRKLPFFSSYLIYQRDKRARSVLKLPGSIYRILKNQNISYLAKI